MDKLFLKYCILLYSIINYGVEEISTFTACIFMLEFTEFKCYCKNLHAFRLCYGEIGLHIITWYVISKVFVWRYRYTLWKNCEIVLVFGYMKRIFHLLLRNPENPVIHENIKFSIHLNWLMNWRCCSALLFDNVYDNMIFYKTILLLVSLWCKQLLFWPWPGSSSA